MEVKSLFNAIKTEDEKTKIIINNIIIMLSNRIYIEDNIKYPLLNKDVIINDKGDNIFIFKANNNIDYAIKILYMKITAVAKQSNISDFIMEYEKYKKILVISDFNNKIMQYVNKNKSQIFKENTLLSDLISYKEQPKFELLSPIEMDNVRNEYNITNYTIKKMLRTDPVAKYYGLKKEEIIRIIRPSALSGESVDYRIIT